MPEKYRAQQLYWELRNADCGFIIKKVHTLLVVMFLSVHHIINVSLYFSFSKHLHMFAMFRNMHTMYFKTIINMILFAEMPFVLNNYPQEKALLIES